MWDSFDCLKYLTQGYKSRQFKLLFKIITRLLKTIHGIVQEVIVLI